MSDKSAPGGLLARWRHIYNTGSLSAKRKKTKLNGNKTHEAGNKSINYNCVCVSELRWKHRKNLKIFSVGGIMSFHASMNWNLLFFIRTRHLKIASRWRLKWTHQINAKMINPLTRYLLVRLSLWTNRLIFCSWNSLSITFFPNKSRRSGVGLTTLEGQSRIGQFIPTHSIHY